MSHTLAAPGRAFVRTLFIVVMMAFAIVLNGGDLLLPWHPFATLGFSASQTGVVTSVDRTAARAGLHVGDRLDVTRMDPIGRVRYLAFLTLAPEGTGVTLPVESPHGDRVVRVTSHLRLRSVADNVTDIISVLALILYALLAGTLVLLRPAPATWAFFAFSYVFFYSGTLVLEYSVATLSVANDFILAVSTNVSSAFFVWFALRFPDNRVSGPAKVAERVLLFALTPALALMTLTSVLLAINGVDASAFMWAAQIAGLCLYATGLGTLAWRYARTDAQNRNRLRWIVAAFAIAFLPELVMNFVAGPLVGILLPVWILNISSAWTVLAPIAVAYTILKHRLFDIRFVFSRALVYAITTALFVGIIALIDWAAGKWLAESKFALLTELALALLVGVSLNALHLRIERFLNGVIFRTQVKALEALRTFMHEIDLIPDPQRLLLQTFEALRLRLESDYVSIYAVDGASYALVRSSGTTPEILAVDDFAVLHLRRWSEPFVCEEPGHPLFGALLLPMSARSELVGFIACGPKGDRTHYLPDESQTLAALAHRTGTAYAWLTLRPASMQIAPSL